MGIRMIDKLIQKIERTGAPIVVGLDPMLKYIPEHLQKKAFAEYGETLQGAAEAVWAFNKEIIDNLYDLIPAVKPQIAMYEQFGIEGLLVFKRTVEYCKEKGLIVIGDVKRGDIGSTSEAYAVGHLGGVQALRQLRKEKAQAVSRPPTGRFMKSSAKRWRNGARTVWAALTAISARLSGRPIRSRERFCGN